MHRKRWKRSCTLCSAVAYCCGAVAPRAIAALLGRFLPRLGPLVHSGGPFFLGRGRFLGIVMVPSGATWPSRSQQSFSGRWKRLKSIQWKRREHAGENGETVGHLGKPLTTGPPP